MHGMCSAITTYAQLRLRSETQRQPPFSRAAALTIENRMVFSKYGHKSSPSTLAMDFLSMSGQRIARCFLQLAQRPLPGKKIVLGATLRAGEVMPSGHRHMLPQHTSRCTNIEGMQYHPIVVAGPDGHMQPLVCMVHSLQVCSIMLT